MSYNRAFLEDYVPGLTWYLPEEVRSHLLELGNSPDRESMAGTYAHEIRQRATAALPEKDGREFIEIVETDLLNLHEGNIARAQLSPREFEAWRTEWVKRRKIRSGAAVP